MRAHRDPHRSREVRPFRRYPGALFVCLDEKIARRDVEPLAFGIAEWHAEVAPDGEASVVFRDRAFADDVAKANCAAILVQRGLGNVRSL